MPIGRVTLRTGTASPVTAPKDSRKNPAYLKYPSTPRLITTEVVKKSFDHLLLESISLPNT